MKPHLRTPNNETLLQIYDLVAKFLSGERVGCSSNCLMYGDVQLFRGTFFLKSAELLVSVFEKFAKLWATCEL